MANLVLDVRSRLHLPLAFAAAVVSTYLVAGCGGEDSSKPAPVDQAQMKKAQEYMSNYREQMVAAHKAQAKSKAKPADKNPK